MDDDRRFTREEAIWLWRRAAILQEADAGLALRPESTSTAEISERILVESGREVDISADYLNLALAESTVSVSNISLSLSWKSPKAEALSTSGPLSPAAFARSG